MPDSGRCDGQRLGRRVPPAQRQARDEVQGALAGSEIAAAPESPAAQRAAAKEYLRIVEWAAADVDPDPAQLGLQGSPTKVKRIENVVFAAKEAKKLTAADNDINELMVELIASHTLG